MERYNQFYILLQLLNRKIVITNQSNLHSERDLDDASTAAKREIIFSYVFSDLIVNRGFCFVKQELQQQNEFPNENVRREKGGEGPHNARSDTKIT